MIVDYMFTDKLNLMNFMTEVRNKFRIWNRPNYYSINIKLKDRFSLSL